MPVIQGILDQNESKLDKLILEQQTSETIESEKESASEETNDEENEKAMTKMQEMQAYVDSFLKC